MKKHMRKRINGYIPKIWNKPGGQNNGNNPWGRKTGGEGPPDLEQIFRQLQRKIRNAFGNTGFSSFSNREGEDRKWLGILFFVLAVILYFISGIYIIDPPERAVITRFGKYVRTEAPGPHWLLPIIESKEVVNVEQVSTSEHSGLMLTRDSNIVSVGVAVQYRIGQSNDDVRAYLFNVVNPNRSLQQSTESALRQVVGQFSMDEVLTSKRSEIATAIEAQIVETLKNYHAGLWVLDVVMQFAKAPDEVRAAFDEVIKASAEEEQLVNQARAYENAVLPKAKGVAERLRNEALGYKQETILVAEGNAQRFNLVLPQYLKAPKVMQTRMYLNTIEQVLSNTSKILLDAGAGNNLIYLPLDRLLNELKINEGKASETSMVSESTSGSSSNQVKEKNQ